MKTFDISMVRENIGIDIQDWICVFTQMIDLLEIELDLDVYLPTYGKNLQRPLVWNLEQKQELILSILKWIRLPYISVVKIIKDVPEELRFTRKKYIYQVIDWKQRLTTIISFLKDEFPIVVNWEEYYHKDLWKFTCYIDFEPLIWNIAYHSEIENEEYDITDDKKVKWFKMINFAGTPQDKDYMNSFTK